MTGGKILEQLRTADDISDESWEAMPAFWRENWIRCPGCDVRRAGPLHRSVNIWQRRADRARENDGTDPESGVTLDDAERHLSALA